MTDRHLRYNQNPSPDLVAPKEHFLHLGRLMSRQNARHSSWNQNLYRAHREDLTLLSMQFSPPPAMRENTNQDSQFSLMSLKLTHLFQLIPLNTVLKCLSFGTKNIFLMLTSSPTVQFCVSVCLDYFHFFRVGVFSFSLFQIKPVKKRNKKFKRKKSIFQYWCIPIFFLSLPVSQYWSIDKQEETCFKIKKINK